MAENDLSKHELSLLFISTYIKKKLKVFNL